MQKMNYTKKSGRRELNETLYAEEGQLEEAPLESESTTPSMDAEVFESYQKGDATILPKLYMLLVEGDSKEPDYFDMLCGNNAYNNLSIFYKPFANDSYYKGNLSHKMATAVDDAIREEKIVIDGDEITITDIDEIYIVMDVDCLHDEIAVEKSQCNHARWIVSNPCFEMWLYYSYANTPETDLKLRNLEISQRSKTLKRTLPSVREGGIGSRQAYWNMPNAIKNSIENYKEDVDGVPALYSTSMHILANIFLSIISKEFHERDKQRKAKIEKYRQKLS